MRLTVIRSGSKGNCYVLHGGSEALMIEAGLFLLSLALMALEAAGLVSCVVAWPVIALTVCVMCVFGGYVIGAVGR